MLNRGKSSNIQTDDSTPLYNSQIISNYLEFIKQYYPEIDIDSLLSYAGIAWPEVEDVGHWFNQNQTNRFNKYLDEKTGNSNIAREAGRYTSSSARIGITKQYALGAITISSVYKLVGKIANGMTRGSTFKVNRIAANKAVILSKPNPGVNEKPYQCKNRIGSLESIAKLFTKSYAEVEHPTCFHTGGELCRYIVTWPNPSSLVWWRIGIYSILVCFFILLGAFVLAPAQVIPILIVGCLVFNLAVWLIIGRTKYKELKETIKTQGNIAQRYLDEIDTQYNNTQLISEIGQTISGCLDINKINRNVLGIIQKHAYYDYGAILIVNEERTKLLHSADFFPKNGQKKLLKMMEYDLKLSDDNGILIECVYYQKNFIIDKVDKLTEELNKKCSEHLELDEIRSVICIPIVYEKESIGVLAVGNRQPDKAITKSDINLLVGITSHVASSIINSVSFNKIKESEKKYRLLANNVRDVIWVLDLDALKISYVSPSIKSIQGFTPEEFIQLPLDRILLPKSFKKVTEIITEELDRADEEKLDPKRTRVLELEQYCKDGSSIWIEVAASFLRDDSMAIVAVLGVARDITERKKSEMERKKLKQELRHAQKMEAIGTLAGGIAHDFNNILSSVIGFTELAMDIDDVEEGTLLHEYLCDVLKAGNRAKDLVSQILTMSRHDDQEVKPIQVVPLIKEALKMLRATIPKSIEFTENISNNQLIVKADPSQLQQVFVNLMTNAKQAMSYEKGVLEVTVHAVDVNYSTKINNSNLSPGRYVHISVSDTGIGIPKENLDKIFDPYFTTKDRGSGTGLGLSVVHGIVKSHNGHIYAKSKPGNGTTFYIYLPLASTGVDEVQIHTTKTLPYGTERILIVDDEPTIVKMLKRSLERLGYKVISRTSSLEAFNEFCSSPNKYDLVITDMTMPKMTEVNPSDCTK